MASTETTDPYSQQDPLPSTVQEGDHILLHFADNRQVFATALPKWKNAKGYHSSCKINKRTYSTHNLIGLRYGTVLEVGKDALVPLPQGEDLLPDAPEMAAVNGVKFSGCADNGGTVNNAFNNISGGCTDVNNNDNRNLIDDNTSQKLTAAHVQTLMSETSTPGSHIVAALISNSATFESKTAFSQAKYVKRKQLKHQPRCHIARVTPSTLCSAMHLKDAKKISNLREDTLGQILSNGNICAGARVIVMDEAVQGIITGSCTRRMGGYGTVIGLFTGQQPSYLDVVNRLNLSACEKQSLKWVPSGEVFGDHDEKVKQTDALRDNATGELRDVEKRDREQIQWPAPLQPHTRTYLASKVGSKRKIIEFMTKRSARFARKLTRHSGLELRTLMDGCCDLEETSGTRAAKIHDQNTEKVKDKTNMKNGEKGTTNYKTQQCDSLIIASKHDPTATLLTLLPYLAPSCPFVIYHEFLEPLLDTFKTLQNYHVPNNNNDSDGNTPMMLRHNIAINLRLTDTFFREYQVLPSRTHPKMSMSQNGGYLLMGTKLCPKTGTNELTEKMMKEIRSKVGGRRKQQMGSERRKKRKNPTSQESSNKKTSLS